MNINDSISVKKITKKNFIKIFLFLVLALRTDAILLKRARHVITEIQRTREAAEALRKRDFKEVCWLFILIEKIKSFIRLRHSIQGYNIRCNWIESQQIRQFQENTNIFDWFAKLFCLFKFVYHIYLWMQFWKHWIDDKRLYVISYQFSQNQRILFRSEIVHHW